MNSFKVFIKKEFMDQIRNKKLMIMLIIMLFCAFISAPSAKYLPELLKSMLKNDAFKIPDPTYNDAFAQFFKNVSQLGLFVLIFLLAGSVSKEKDTGSAIIVLTKPLTRATMVLSKFIVSTVLFTITYFVGYGIHLLYTQLLFNEIGNINAFLSILMMWYYCVFIIAITISLSAIFKKGLMSGIVSFVVLFVLSILSSLPVIKLDKLSPGALATVNSIVLSGNMGKEMPNAITGQVDIYTWGELGIAAAITTALLILFLVTGIKVFEKQEL